MLVAAACALICFCSIAIVASSRSHSFDPQRVNMTHRVHQLSFINPVQEGTHLLTKDKEKMFRSESMNEKWHVSKEGHASIEHYVKVLSLPPHPAPISKYQTEFKTALQVLHVTDISAMGYTAEEYKYTSASGLVSENKELVPGNKAACQQPRHSFVSYAISRDKNFIRPFPSLRHQQPPTPFFSPLCSSGQQTEHLLNPKPFRSSLNSNAPPALRYHRWCFHCFGPRRRVHVPPSPPSLPLACLQHSSSHSFEHISLMSCLPPCANLRANIHTCTFHMHLHSSRFRVKLQRHALVEEEGHVM
jgi:hypothetical protein